MGPQAESTKHAALCKAKSLPGSLQVDQILHIFLLLFVAVRRGILLDTPLTTWQVHLHPLESYGLTAIRIGLDDALVMAILEVGKVLAKVSDSRSKPITLRAAPVLCVICQGGCICQVGRICVGHAWISEMLAMQRTASHSD